MNRSQKYRLIGVNGIFFAVYGLLILNLYMIQIKWSSFYKNLGEQQYGVTITTNPPRAVIIDRTGQKYLALNNEKLSAFIIPNKLKEPERVRSFLANNFPDALKRLNDHPKRHFLYIKRTLSHKEIQLIKEHNLIDIHLLSEPNRFYPVACAGPITGITSIDNQGLFGIELQCNEQLAGKPNTCVLEKDARSGYFYFAKKTMIEGNDAQPIQLTIDSDLQFLAYHELKKTAKQFGARETAVVVMDPSGDILVMASTPCFDPNNTKNLTIAHTKNRPITETYELGSVFKVFTALAALEENLVTVDEEIDCKGSRTAIIDGRRVNTTIAHGVLSFADVIAKSNNIGTAQVAKRLNEKLYDHYTKLGFGKKTGILFPGEQSGFVNPPSNWSKQSVISLSYGYEVTATLLQLASAFCLIANNGIPVKPRLIMTQKKSFPENQPLYSEKSIREIQAILENTTLRGTSRRAGIKGYRVMSKTGTANLLENGVYTDKKNIYTCAGIVQKGDYQRIIVTFVKEVSRYGLYASQVAAPLFERIAEKILIHDKII